MSTTANVQKLDSEEEFVEHARKIFQKLQTIDPTNVRCMLGMIVTELPGNDDEADVHGFVLGSDEDITKMFSALAMAISNGIVQADTSSTNTSEVKH